MKSRRQLLVCLITLLACWHPHARADVIYDIAIVPQYTPVDIGQRWAPLLARVQKETGIQLRVQTSQSIPEFEAEVMNGKPDFVFLNPYHMLMAAKAQRYRPLVHGSEALSGILVVRRDGPIKRLQDLNGATLAMPAPNAFGASLYLRALLRERERISFTPLYVGTHQNVYRNVLNGAAQAGGGIEASLEKEPAAVRQQLAVLFRTPGTASHPLAVHPRVRGGDVEKVAHALRRMADDPEGRQMLSRVELEGAAQADYERDYAPLLGLRLDRYIEQKK